MTLGTWFRDYLYFPLGGSRVSGKWRLVFNLAVVWLCTGLWHGADWSFLLWGAWYGLIIIAEKLLGLPKRLKTCGARLGYRAVTLLAVLFGWVLFRAESLFAAGQYVAAMLGYGNGYGDAGFYLSEYFLIFAVALVASTPLLKRLKERLLQAKPQWRTALGALGVLSQVVLFCVGVSFLVMDAHDPFIYFNF